jgi:hypothetical protein
MPAQSGLTLGNGRCVSRLYSTAVEDGVGKQAVTFAAEEAEVQNGPFLGSNLQGEVVLAAMPRTATGLAEVTAVARVSADGAGLIEPFV